MEGRAATSRTRSFGNARGGEWLWRTMFDEIPLPLDWPVYVSHAEASAYAKWAGVRLPTEAEWHRAAYGTPGRLRAAIPWGDEPPAPPHGYYDFARWDPAPVNAFPGGRSAFGVDGLLANGWEWTATPFAPFRRISSPPLLCRLFGRFFRRQALRSQGRFHAHGREHAAPLFPQLVPAALSVCLCRIPLREGSLEPWRQERWPWMSRPPSQPTSAAGLTRPGQKELPSKYLYDELGSKLFEAISLLPEYGLTRADERLLRAHAPTIVRAASRRYGGGGTGKRQRW